MFIYFFALQQTVCLMKAGKRKRSVNFQVINKKDFSLANLRYNDLNKKEVVEGKMISYMINKARPQVTFEFIFSISKNFNFKITVYLLY